uniref:Putative septum site-determining protein MinD n=1 Tax=Prototheca cutis TaxID=575411 RepID=A0A2Z6BES7_9CHLO|nr:cell division protein [Prototheca cutis]BBD20228.1 cell division protein [Prototheca cutis]
MKHKIKTYTQVDLLDPCELEKNKQILNKFYEIEPITYVKYLSEIQVETPPSMASMKQYTKPLLQENTKARVLVVTSGKGGVGKTTTTANLGMSLARFGYRVALIDADIGLRNLDLLLGLENRINFTAMDIIEGKCRLDQALVRDKRWKNLALLAVSKNNQKYNVTQRHMRQLVSSILELGYQFVLIDCPAGIDVGFINAIAPAQEAIIVTTPDITAIRDADRVVGLLEANTVINSTLLVNRVRMDMIQNSTMLSVKDVQETIGINLLGAIPEDPNVIISTNRGEPLVLDKKLTLSGIAFENAARRLIGQEDYLVELYEPPKGMIQKLQNFFLGDN